MKIEILEEKFEGISRNHKEYVAKFKLKITKFFFFKTVFTVYLMAKMPLNNVLYGWELLNRNVMENAVGIFVYYEILNILRERALLASKGFPLDGQPKIFYITQL